MQSLLQVHAVPLQVCLLLFITCKLSPFLLRQKQQEPSFPKQRNGATDYGIRIVVRFAISQYSTEQNEVRYSVKINRSYPTPPPTATRRR
jgi:hypothetical protein